VDEIAVVVAVAVTVVVVLAAAGLAEVRDGRVFTHERAPVVIPPHESRKARFGFFFVRKLHIHISCTKHKTHTTKKNNDERQNDDSCIPKNTMRKMINDERRDTSTKKKEAAFKTNK
jgi:hypothetical protein